MKCPRVRATLSRAWDMSGELPPGDEIAVWKHATKQIVEITDGCPGPTLIGETVVETALPFPRTRRRLGLQATNTSIEPVYDCTNHPL